LQRYILLDLIRFLALLGVVAVHLFQVFDNPLGGFFGLKNFYYVSIGGLSVTIFIILSGLVLELTYQNRDIGYIEFVRKRIFRLYPIYYLALLLGIITYAIQLYYGVLPDVYRNIGPFDVLFSLAAFYPFVGKWGGPFVPTSWFIGLIVGLYFLYPVIAATIRKRPHITILTLLVISAATRFFVGNYHLLPTRPLDWFPLCRVFEFGFGIYLAHIVNKEQWKMLNGTGRMQSVIMFCGAISFPLFLVHRNILDIIKYLPDLGIGPTLWVPLFFVLSLWISWLFLRFDHKIKQFFAAGKMAP